jgi:DNA-binding beta-propeller fold protein YncE
LPQRAPLGQPATRKGGNNVTKLRASDGKLLGTFTLASGATPFGVVFDGANIWVANNFFGSPTANVSKLRACDGKLLGTFPVGVGPVGIAFDGANIWTANGNDGTVTKLRASDGKLLGTFPVGMGPYGVAFDGTNIWVTLYNNTVVKMRASDGNVLGTFPVGSSPHGLVFDGALSALLHTTPRGQPSRCYYPAFAWRSYLRCLELIYVYSKLLTKKLPLRHAVFAGS